VFGGRQDTDVTEEDLTAWGEVTRGGCVLKMMEGDHFFIHTQAAELMLDVSRILQRPR
jgi:medium-chain acyl-[acyl-carrier-protein] hydrolase